MSVDIYAFWQEGGKFSGVMGGPVEECPSSNKWNRSDVRLSECFAHHFHVTRRSVDIAIVVSR
jgi:hypothetical protein